MKKSNKKTSRRRNTKNRFILILILIFAVILISLFIFTPISDIVGLTNPGLCTESHYAQGCTCPDGFNKIYVPWIGIPKWNCEEISQMTLDPESPTFEQDAITFVRDYLNKYCGSICTDLSCGNMDSCVQGLPPEGQDRCIDASFGYDSSGKRLVNVECNVVKERDSEGRATSGYTSWHMNFYVESGTGVVKTRGILERENYCMNPDLTEKCTTQSFCDSYLSKDPDALSWCKPYLQINVTST